MTPLSFSPQSRPATSCSADSSLLLTGCGLKAGSARGGRSASPCPDRWPVRLARSWRLRPGGQCAAGTAQSPQGPGPQPGAGVQVRRDLLRGYPRGLQQAGQRVGRIHRPLPRHVPVQGQEIWPSGN